MLLSKYISCNLSNKVHKSQNTGSSTISNVNARIFLLQSNAHWPVNLVENVLIFFKEFLTKSIGLLVIFDCKVHEVLGLLVNSLCWKLFIVLKCINISIVNAWLHNIANSVMSANIKVVSVILNTEMLT